MKNSLVAWITHSEMVALHIYEWSQLVRSVIESKLPLIEVNIGSVQFLKHPAIKLKLWFEISYFGFTEISWRAELLKARKHEVTDLTEVNGPRSVESAFKLGENSLSIYHRFKELQFSLIQSLPMRSFERRGYAEKQCLNSRKIEFKVTEIALIQSRTQEFRE